MDEAKTLVHMSISAIFASMFLAAAIGLIAVGHMMWNSLSRQDAANKRLADYANYTAFDNTTVRGQEIISLIESNPDIFIFIYDANPSTNVTDINEIESFKSDPIAKYLANNSSVKSYEPSSLPTTENSIKTCEKVLLKFKSMSSTTVEDVNVVNLANKSHEKLIKYFTTGNSGTALGRPGDSEIFSYAAFKSVLVYDSDSTTDIVGILFVRQSKYITQF